MDFVAIYTTSPLFLKQKGLETKFGGTKYLHIRVTAVSEISHFTLMYRIAPITMSRKLLVDSTQPV